MIAACDRPWWGEGEEERTNKFRVGESTSLLPRNQNEVNHYKVTRANLSFSFFSPTKSKYISIVRIYSFVPAQILLGIIFPRR